MLFLFLDALRTKYTTTSMIKPNKTNKKNPKDFDRAESYIPISLIPESCNVAFALSNCDYPYSKMGSDTGLSVIASSTYVKSSIIRAGQPEKNRI